jgi:uncharacterized protein
MRALLDVNVLIALFDPDHTSHHTALEWFAAHATSGWASCPITQNGCLRVMSHHAYPNSHTVQQIASRLHEATEQEVHAFWPDDVSLLDARRVDTSRVHGPRQLTDVYLLALAVQHGGRFVTFDQSIAREAVIGAKAKQLVVL